MKKNIISAVVVSMLMVSCQPAPAMASSNYAAKQMMRGQAYAVCDAVGIFSDSIDECVDIISEDYYDAAMKGAHSVIKGKGFSNNAIVDYTFKHLDCGATVLSCQMNRRYYASWVAFGMNTIKDGDTQFKKEAEMYYGSGK